MVKQLTKTLLHLFALHHFITFIRANIQLKNVQLPQSDLVFTIAGMFKNHTADSHKLY